MLLTDLLALEQQLINQVNQTSLVMLEAKVCDIAVHPGLFKGIFLPMNIRNGFVSINKLAVSLTSSRDLQGLLLQ